MVTGGIPSLAQGLTIRAREGRWGQKGLTQTRPPEAPDTAQHSRAAAPEARGLKPRSGEGARAVEGLSHTTPGGQGGVNRGDGPLRAGRSGHWGPEETLKNTQKPPEEVAG